MAIASAPRSASAVTSCCNLQAIFLLLLLGWLFLPVYISSGVSIRHSCATAARSTFNRFSFTVVSTERSKK